MKLGSACDKNQDIKEERPQLGFGKGVGEIKIWGPQEKLQRPKGTLHKIAQQEPIEMTTEDLSEFEDGILVICQETKEEEKTGEDHYKKANWQKDAEKEECSTPPFTGRYKLRGRRQQ